MEIPPDHQRVPRHLSAAQAQEALTELDAKLATLRRRVHATAADSATVHTYHEHIAGLERKRGLLQTLLAQAGSAAEDESVWTDLKSGIDTLRQDLKRLLD
ncbi:MAG: hypothetical protein H7330_15020 [Hymenobacteraceae bacterium]|nr:hypothetical protein [Hymenobacteraceae bacterium]